MKKVLAMVMAAMMALMVPTANAALYGNYYDEEMAKEYLEELTGVKAYFALHINPVVIIGDSMATIDCISHVTDKKNESYSFHNLYSERDICILADEYMAGNLEKLPPVTAKLERVLTQEVFEFNELLRLLEMEGVSDDDVELSYEGYEFFIPVYVTRGDVLSWCAKSETNCFHDLLTKS